MSGETAQPPVPQVRKSGGPSIVWLIPLVVALAGAWLTYKTLAEKGPVITIAFRTAAGIEAGKTKLRYKNIEVGVVESVQFSDDFSYVLLTAQMAAQAATFLRRGSRFWVVRPRLSARGISGLGTLVSGAYIEVEPGAGAEQHHFEGLEAPPVVRADENGRRVTLIAPKLGSLGPGSPVSYRGIEAGEVLGHELGTDRKSVLIYAFIKAPFSQLVRSNTRFWNVSGVDVALNSAGLTVRTESMQAVMFGGIAFETSEASEPLKADLDEVVFTLFESKSSIAEQSFTKRVRFVLFFDGSVRGLNLGAPVEFKGIKVGAVVDIRLEFDATDTTFRIPVVIEIEPERIIFRDDKAPSAIGLGPPVNVLTTLVERGLRARLQTGSLLTGQLFVELDMHPDTPIRLVQSGAPYPELPTIRASLEEITASVKGVLEKVNQFDFKRINDAILSTLEGANRLTNAPEIKTALNELEVALSAFGALARKVDARVEPMVSNVDKTMTLGHTALSKLQGTLRLVDDVLKSDSPLQGGYIQLADELTETARSIKSFVDLLARNPEAVIFGK
ncbi:MAG: MCE family protein [Gammaproteobacteria bacterium]|nr:MCE family protein [Gammaproteobacteria bacterium]